MFDALAISGTGMGVHQKWLDALSDNIANANTARPTNESAFRARWVVAQSIEDGGTGRGVAVGGIELGSAQGRLVHSPDHPLADAKGYVRMPDIDMAEQMSDLVLAQRGYQLNIASLERVRASYQAAIQMGRA